METNNIKLEYYPQVPNDILRGYINRIQENKGKWDAPFFVDTKTHIHLDEIKKTAAPFKTTDIKNIIILGTGGSIQTMLALKHLSKKKIFPVTSSRSVELIGCLNKTKPEDSIVIPISRGGETIDINSTIGIFLKRGYKFLGLSSMGKMYEILKKIDCPILDVPDLTGRFAGSASNVGIVPAYLAEINIENLVKGLDDGYRRYMKMDENDSIKLASFFYHLYKKGYTLVFSMPYSKNLEGSIGLLVQEISESTGKGGKGLIGAYQEAPLCQHSILEYLLGGTKGAVIPLVWSIEKEIPDIILESSIDYVNNQSAQTIVNYQADATFQALIEQAVPCAKISLKDPGETSIGNIIALIQSTVYYLCLLLDVNWADNPKVVIGKKICNEALKNKTPDEERKKIREEIAKNKY